METVTLKELNVKPRDVVKYADGIEYTISENHRLIHPDGDTRKAGPLRTADEHFE